MGVETFEREIRVPEFPDLRTPLHERTYLLSKDIRLVKSRVPDDGVIRLRYGPGKPRQIADEAKCVAKLGAKSWEVGGRIQCLVDCNLARS